LTLGGVRPLRKLARTLRTDTRSGRNLADALRGSQVLGSCPLPAQERSLSPCAQFTRERSLRQVHLAQERLVARVALEILEERGALHRKEILIPLRECAVQPCERGVLLCAESVSL
jgi:hypothetical protein